SAACANPSLSAFLGAAGAGIADNQHSRWLNREVERCWETVSADHAGKAGKIGCHAQMDFPRFPIFLGQAAETCPSVGAFPTHPGWEFDVTARRAGASGEATSTDVTCQTALTARSCRVCGPNAIAALVSPRVPLRRSDARPG